MKKFFIVGIIVIAVIAFGALVFVASRREKPYSVPLPQEEDIIRTFFALIAEKRPSDAVSMMSKNITENDSQKQAWAVQFNAISSITVLKIEPSLTENWTNSEQAYKLTLSVQLNPASADAPIPYYGWDDGENTRWVTIVKENNLWKIKGLATGP